MADHWTESEVFGRLGKLFPAPAWVLMAQVRTGTGLRKQVRTADALAASVWPSRGLYFVGFEIKVSRSDWRRELAAAPKSVELQQYCRQWYVAAPAGVVPAGEVPETWGLIECTAARASIVREAPRLKERPVDLAFVMSVLRRQAESTVPADEVDERVQAAVSAALEARLAERRHAYDALADAVRRFEEGSGVRIADGWRGRPIGQAVQAVLSAGAINVRGQMELLRRTAERIAGQAAAAMAQLEGAAGAAAVEACDGGAGVGAGAGAGG